MRNPVKSLFLVVIQFACLIALAVSGPLLATTPLLLIVQFAALALGVWAIVSMRGGPFNIVPDPKTGGQLVQHGPYRWIRHPMYAALLLLTLPLVIESPSTIRWFFWLVLLTDLVVKLTYEESLLVEHHPGYLDYQRQTKRLIPFVF